MDTTPGRVVGKTETRENVREPGNESVRDVLDHHNHRECLIDCFY